MKLIISIIFILGFIQLRAFASSGGGSSYLPAVQLKKPTSKPPTSSGKQKYDYRPSPRKLKELKTMFFKLKRPGVTINSVSLDAAYFTIKGNYKKEAGLVIFMKQLKGEGNPDRELKLEKKKERGFAGIINQTYEISGKNIW